MVGGQAGGPGPSTSTTPTPLGGGVVVADPAPPASTTPLLNLHSVLTLQQGKILTKYVMT